MPKDNLVLTKTGDSIIITHYYGDLFIRKIQYWYYTKAQAIKLFKAEYNL